MLAAPPRNMNALTSKRVSAESNVIGAANAPFPSAGSAAAVPPYQNEPPSLRPGLAHSSRPVKDGLAKLASRPSRSEERRVGKGVDLGGRRIIKKKKKKAGMERGLAQRADSLRNLSARPGATRGGPTA